MSPYVIERLLIPLDISEAGRWLIMTGPLYQRLLEGIISRYKTDPQVEDICFTYIVFEPLQV